MCRPLAATLERLPATKQERLFARLYFLFPLAIAVLSVFWIASGLITLANPARAMAVLLERNIAGWIAAPIVFGGALADSLLGLAILWRPKARLAALGMIALSSLYLLGSLIVAFDLWSDPLGPMVKVVPGVILAGMVAAMMDER